jgi:serine/threonine-protein kinase
MKPSVEDIWDALARSRQLSPKEIGDVRQRWDHRPLSGRSGEDEDAPDRLVRWLVAEQYVTEYQAELLAESRPARFFLGPYKLLDRAGAGRLTVVYRARHGLGAVVAVKTLAPVVAQDRRLRARFRREAGLAVRLKHPNVVRTLHVEDDDGMPYLLMEYLEGQTLRELLATRRLGLEEAVDLVIQALLGLQYLSEHGAMPRALGPADMMVVRASGGTGRPGLKIIGTRLGLAESDGDVRAGIYGLGCVLYHALAGQPPFPNASALGLAARHATELPRPVRDLNSAVPAGLQQVLGWMMAEDPVQRYQTPLRAAQALRLVLLSRKEAEDLSPDAGPASPSDANGAGPVSCAVQPTQETVDAIASAPCWEEILREEVEVPAPSGPHAPLTIGRREGSFTRRDCLALLIGGGGLLGAQAVGWLLARVLRRPRARGD